jgi:hypothetical protein
MPVDVLWAEPRDTQAAAFQQVRAKGQRSRFVLSVYCMLNETAVPAAVVRRSFAFFAVMPPKTPPLNFVCQDRWKRLLRKVLFITACKMEWSTIDRFLQDWRKRAPEVASLPHEGSITAGFIVIPSEQGEL